MSQAKCPQCGFGFDNHRNSGVEQLRGRMIFGPERLVANPKMDAAATDTCPKCGSSFPSSEFQVFGDFSRAKLRSMAGVYATVGVVVVALALSVWLSGK